MSFNDYQERTHATARYPEHKAVEYLTLGLCSEDGELAGKVKKVLRDHGGIFSQEDLKGIHAEIGDILWYVSELCTRFGFNMGEVAHANLLKLADRAARNAIAGSGDNR